MWNAHQKLREIAKQYDDMNKIILEWQNTIEFQSVNNLHENESFDHDEVFVPYVSIRSGTRILRGLGIHYSHKQLNIRLLELGVIAEIEGAFPVSEFLSFLNGTLITNPKISNSLQKNKKRILDNIRQVEGRYIDIGEGPTILFYKE